MGDSGGMHRTTRFFLAAPLAALLSLSAAAAPPLPWQPTWFSAAQPVWGAGWIVPLGMPASLHDVTLRQSLRSSLGGGRVRLVVSNEYGGAPLTLGPVALRQHGAEAVHAVRFQGRDGTVVPAGARVVSDPLALSVTAGERLEVDLHLPQPTATAGFHWDAQEQTLLLQGNAVGHRTAPVLQVLQSRAFVSGLWVDTGQAPATVVALGDSITDGNGSGMGTDQRWPDHLSRRLAQRGVAVLNAGIAGNRLLRGGWGDSALARLERDVLAHPGVRAVVVLLGTNDIGFPGSPFAPAEAPAALAELQAGLRQLVTQAHARGVRVMAGTLPPFEQALQGTPLQGHHSPAKEAQRAALNAWIRQAGVFDAVVDFDAVLRDPAHPARLAPALDSGDHLHPGDAGYRRMAEAIDLDALLGTAAEGAGP